MAHWHAPPGWRWLTGTHAQLARVWRAYGIDVRPEQGDIVHGAAVYLVDPRGYERAVSGARGTSIASDNACSVLIPILSQVLRMRTPEIRSLFELQGLTLHDWERARTDRVRILEVPAPAIAAMA